MQAKKQKMVAELAKAFRTAGTTIAKVAPQVRAVIGGAKDDNLKKITVALYDAIRADQRNEKGQLTSWAKVPADVKAAYDAARQAVSRYLRQRDAKSRGPVVKLTSAQKAYNRAFDARAELQKAEDCPAELLAAFDAAMATAVRLGATAKQAK